MRVRSRQSTRTVRTQRSAYALAFGAGMAVRITLIPSVRKTSSKAWLNFASRSWTRNRVAAAAPADARSPTRVAGQGSPAPSSGRRALLERQAPGGDRFFPSRAIRCPRARENRGGYFSRRHPERALKDPELFGEGCAQAGGRAAALKSGGPPPGASDERTVDDERGLRQRHLARGLRLLDLGERLQNPWRRVWGALTRSSCSGGGSRT
jgi:hypothetical protein